MGNMHQTGVWNSGLFSSELFGGQSDLMGMSGAPFMAFIDYVDIEGTLVFPILTEDVGGEAVNADSPPTYDILSADQSAVLVDDVATTAISGRTGVYRVSQSITAALGFAAGNTYTLIASWDVNGSARQKAYTFKVT